MALSQCEYTPGAVTFTKGLTSTTKSKPMSTHHLNNSWPQPHIFLNSLIQYIAAYAEFVRIHFNVTLPVTTLGLNPKTTIMQANNRTHSLRKVHFSAVCAVRKQHGCGRGRRRNGERSKGETPAYNPQKRCWLSCDLLCAASRINNACRCVKTLSAHN